MFCLVESNPVKLETSYSVILPPMLSVLWHIQRFIKVLSHSLLQFASCLKEIIEWKRSANCKNAVQKRSAKTQCKNAVQKRSRKLVTDRRRLPILSKQTRVRIVVYAETDFLFASRTRSITYIGLLTYFKCDQMFILFVQYSAIYNSEIDPMACIICKNWLRILPNAT